MFLIFLDIDGVLNTLPGASLLDPGLVANLNWICDHTQPSIVTNSAWNQHDLDTLKEMLVEAGFKHPDRLIGKTEGTEGGGALVRHWLVMQNHVGTPYAIVDDSAHDGTRTYGEMWGRLVKCDGRFGLTPDIAQQVREIYQRGCDPLDEIAERRAAVEHLLDHCIWLSNSTPWLNGESRGGFIKVDLDRIQHCLTVPDFLGAALLQPRRIT